MNQLILYYDIVCPFAYLASTQVEALAERAGVEITWTPMLLGGVFRAIGAAAAAAPPAKARHSHADMLRWAALYGVPLQLHPLHPLRTVEAMRLCHAVFRAERVRVTHALYRAYFVESRDISQRAVLAEIAAEAGCPGAVRQIDAPEIKEALKRATAEAVADGVFGAPSFVVVRGGRRMLFWGQDRMHFVEKALAGWDAP
jgi:2-hydroxychromene-2-carboxylate isomerase